MPVHQGEDETGSFFQWGESGKKYYYDEDDDTSREDAEDRARRQGRAAYARGYREPGS